MDFHPVWVVGSVLIGLMLLAVRHIGGASDPPVRLGTANIAPSALSPAELGFLAGGPRRAANVVLAAMVTGGTLRVDRRGMLDPVVGGPGPADELQQEVVQHLTSTSSEGRRAEAIRRRLGSGKAMFQLTDRLARRGLLLTGLETRSGMSRLLTLPALAGVLFTVPPLITLLTGLSQEKTSIDGYGLDAAIVVGGFLAGGYGIGAYRRVRRQLAYRAGEPARQAVAAARSSYQAGVSPVMLGVALLGLDELHDPEIEAGLDTRDMPSTAGPAGNCAGAYDGGGGGGDGDGGGGDGGCGGGCGG